MAVYVRNMLKLRGRNPFYFPLRNHVTHDSIQVKPLKNIFFGKYLILTNTISAGVLMFLGDSIQQEAEYRSGKVEERHDWERSKKMANVGFVIGFLDHWYYKYLEIFLPGRALKMIGLKIFLDQVIASPIYITTFFYGTGLQEKKSLRECTNELKQKVVKVYLGDWLIWPPTQFINFYYVKPEYRVLYVNVVTMIYDVFLSYMKHT